MYKEEVERITYYDIEYFDTIDTYNYIGSIKADELTVNLYHGETHDHTISDKTIKAIIQGGLERQLQEMKGDNL